MKSALMLLALLCCGGTAAAELCGGTPMPANADALDRLIVQTMRASHIPGMSVAVLDHGHVVKLRGYGFADLESCVPATENTLFGIGSVSKQMTAVGILTLVRDGKLSLDDPITKYLPEGKGVWDAVHIRHLLTHTSGIPDIYGDDDKFPSMHPDRTASPSTPDLVKSFAIGKLNFAPGENWAYSNTGYVLLSVIAERVSGEPFPAFMHERVFAPLDMSSTRNYSPTELIPGRGTPYHIDDKGVATHGPFISDVFSHWGDTAFISTASDMSRWAQALGRDKILPPALWKEMLTPVRLRDGTPYPYGFGMMLSQVGGDRLWKHNGTFKAGYFADLLDFPDRSLNVAVLSNYYGDDGESFFKLPPTVVGTLEPQLALIETRAAPPDPEVQLTQSLLKAMSGAGGAGTGYARPYAKYSPYPERLRQVFAHTPSAKLRYFGCAAATGTPPDAFGTAVTRECTYAIEGAPQVPGFMLWLSDHDEIAGITFW
jgi:CubicO group peptidase (beta-lactamase class C family)